MLNLALFVTLIVICSKQASSITDDDRYYAKIEEKDSYKNTGLASVLIAELYILSSALRNSRCFQWYGVIRSKNIAEKSEDTNAAEDVGVDTRVCMSVRVWVRIRMWMDRCDYQFT